MRLRLYNIELAEQLRTFDRGPSRVWLLEANETSQGDLMAEGPGELVPLERLSRLRMRRGQWVEVHSIPQGVPLPSDTNIRRELEQHGPLHEGDLLAVLAGGLEPTRIIGLSRRGAETPAPIAAVVVVGQRLEVYPFPHIPSLSSLPFRSDRYVGALGGPAVWSALSMLRIAVVGAGGLGSQVTELLARAGVLNQVVIDPDVIEAHNLHRMGLATGAHVGCSKAQVVAEQAAWTGTLVQAIRDSVVSTDGLSALLASDVLVCAADRGSIRLFCGLVASLVGLVLLDIGTGVRLESGQRQAGFDVRLLLPGSCIMCSGGIRGEQQSIRELMNELSGVERSQRSVEPWQRGARLGSLSSLNHSAAGAAVGLLEELVAGRLQSSVWLHWEVRDGVPGLERLPVESVRGCPLCSRWRTSIDVQEENSLTRPRLGDTRR